MLERRVNRAAHVVAIVLIVFAYSYCFAQSTEPGERVLPGPRITSTQYPDPYLCAPCLHPRHEESGYE
jgi:hypothetical protein